MEKRETFLLSNPRQKGNLRFFILGYPYLEFHGEQKKKQKEKE